MKLTINPTSTIIDIDGAKCRVWEGASDKGTPVTCFIAVVASPRGAEQSDLERELTEVEPRAAGEAWPTRMII